MPFPSFVIYVFEFQDTFVNQIVFCQILLKSEAGRFKDYCSAQAQVGLM